MRDKLKRKMSTVRLPRWGTWLRPTLVSGFVVAVAFFGLHWLSVLVERLEIDDAELGSVLEAQAAMTAIFLAAMIFIVEAVQRREGLDDPLYELFLSKSWARWIFATAVWLLIGTALLYVFGPFTTFFSELAEARADAIGISSLIVAAGLVLLFLLRALHVLKPEQYRELRREAVLEQVRRGARSQARASESMDRRLQQIIGVLSDPEIQAARAIERVVDQTYQAVEQTQLTEIREGIALLEEICKVIITELEESRDERPEISTFDDQQWLGHDNMLAGMQRFVRGAANEVAHESILRAIFHADVERARTSYSTPYRLSENIQKTNILFLQVMIECIEQEQESVVRLPSTPFTFSFNKEPVAEMLSDALGSALSGGYAAIEGSWSHRIALRMTKFIHEFAGSAALRRETDLACALLESFLYHVKDLTPTDDEESMDDDRLSSALRRAFLSSIGYSVGIGNHDFIDTAKRSTAVIKLLESRQTHHLDVALEQDFVRHFGGRSILGGGPLWLTRGIRSGTLPLDTELDVQRAYAECVVLGYMWLLGLVYKGIGEVVLPSEVQPEFNRVWHLYSGRLVSALRRAGIGEDRDLWSWCEAAFSVSRS